MHFTVGEDYCCCRILQCCTREVELPVVLRSLHSGSMIHVAVVVLERSAAKVHPRELVEAQGVQRGRARSQYGAWSVRAGCIYRADPQAPYPEPRRNRSRVQRLGTERGGTRRPVGALVRRVQFRQRFHLVGPVA
jgi:hypothetical protein